MSRDPKGIYRKAREHELRNVPGLQSAYEAPLRPDVVVHGAGEPAEAATARILAELAEKGYCTSKTGLLAFPRKRG